MTEKLRILVVTNHIQSFYGSLHNEQHSGVEAGAMGRPVVFLWSPEMVWLNSMAPLKALFVRSPDELVLRVSQLLNDPGFYQTYTDRSVHLCSRHPGLHENAVDALVSIFLEEEQA